MMPSCDQVGTPSGLFAFFHFASSSTFESTSSINVRTRASNAKRQSGPSFFGATLFATVLAMFHLLSAHRTPFRDMRQRKHVEPAEHQQKQERQRRIDDPNRRLSERHEAKIGG